MAGPGKDSQRDARQEWQVLADLGQHRGTHMKLSPRESEVLSAWAHISDRDYSILNFADVEEECGVQRPRRYVRALARKGLLYQCQIFKEYSGKVAGSGYAPTDAGWDLIDSLFADHKG